MLAGLSGSERARRSIDMSVQAVTESKAWHLRSTPARLSRPSLIRVPTLSASKSFPINQRLSYQETIRSACSGSGFPSQAGSSQSSSIASAGGSDSRTRTASMWSGCSPRGRSISGTMATEPAQPLRRKRSLLTGVSARFPHPADQRSCSGSAEAGTERRIQQLSVWSASFGDRTGLADSCAVEQLM